MLILGRRANQTIVFPNCGITVRILDVNGRVAKIGIEASRSIQVVRGELAAAMASAPPSDYVTATTGDRYEQVDAPESEPHMLQFGQRLADLKSNLHVFQQLRAAGNEQGADSVLAELLSDLASLDHDWLQSQQDGENPEDRTSRELVSETKMDYGYYAPKTPRPIYLLVIRSNDSAFGDPHSTIALHGCQTCTVNGLAAANQAIESQELFDYIVCDCEPKSFDELNLLRTIRNKGHLDGARVFATTHSQDRVEQLALAHQYGIDGWLELPLCPQNLWNHIVESKQLDT